MAGLPSWLKSELVSKRQGGEVLALLNETELNTVCVSAKCPNRGLCFSQRTATFMILGDVCTRNCGFCAVTSGKPAPVDYQEVTKIVDMARRLKLKHVVITSVTRDDLADQGVGQFVAVVAALKNLTQPPQVEILTPDFQAEETLLARIATLAVDIFNHNVETVPRLYSQVRPQADYQRSLKVLRRIKELNGNIVTKSGLMVGLGEAEVEVLQVLRDLRAAGVEMVTIGQYLRPGKANLPVAEYITPETFARYGEAALELGFSGIASAPLVRSSFLAESLWENTLKGAVCQ